MKTTNESHAIQLIAGNSNRARSLKGSILIAAIVAAIFLVFIACGNSRTGDMSSPGNTGNKGTAASVFYSVVFDSNGGTPVESQSIKKGKKAVMPEDPTMAIETEGLYPGTPEITLEGWYNGETKWDFNAPVTADITLKANWDIPVPLELPAGNIVDKAIAYIDNKAGVYTLFLGNDYSVAAKTLNNNSKLVIIGAGQERTISLSANGTLLTIRNNFELTLGKNITLRGKSGNDNALVVLSDRASKLNMLEGSKITGNSGKPDNDKSAKIGGAGVEVKNGVFTMKGGEITGNTNNWRAFEDFAYAAASGVFISRFGTLVMKGGRIAGNSGGVANVVYMAGNMIDADKTANGPDLVLSGDATIESIALTSQNYTVEKSIGIECDNWNPSDKVTLHLSASGWFGHAIDSAETRDIFLGAISNGNKDIYILKAVSGDLSDALDKLTLGNFFNDHWGNTAISPYKILSSGKLGK